MQRESTAERLRSTVPGLWRERRAILYRVLILALGVVAVAWSLRAAWHFTIDDAGISYAYAKHLAEGQGPVAVVGGPWVEGYSNPLWVFLLVPLHALGLDLPVAAQWLGALLFGLALAAGCAFICRVSGRRIRELGAVEACFVLVSTLCLELVVWVPAGLENALFGALLLGMLARDARESEDPALLPMSALLAFGLSITRPEGVMYAAPLVLIRLARALSRREPMRRAWLALLSFALPLALYHVGHYLVFGHLLPNTYWAKPGGKTWNEGFEYLSRTMRESGLAYALPLALVGLYGKLRSKLLAAWAALAGVLFVLYSGGDWMPHGRFLSLFAPALLALSAVGLARVADLAVLLTRGRVPREASAFVLSAAIAIAWWGQQRPRLAALRAEKWCHFCERVADTASVQRLGARAALPSASLLTHDFGGPSWLSSEAFQPLDFLGLCDRSAALIRHRRAPGSVAFDHRLYQYFIHEQGTAPSWVLLPPNFWPRFDRSPEHLLDYYALSARLVPHARRDSFFALHRGELVDYFPPLEPSVRRPLGQGLTLVGAALEAEPDSGTAPALGSGVPVRVRLAVVPEREIQGSERIAVRIEAAGERVESEPARLDRGIDGVGRRLAPGEPLAFEIPLRLPPTAAGSYRLSVGVFAASAGSRKAGRDRGAASFSEVVEIGAGAALLAPARELPRYPSALPVALDAELRALRPRVTRVIEQSRSSGRAPADPALANQLIALGERLEAGGDGAQAYLAYVFATQVRRRAWERLADRVFRLRQLSLGDEHPFEITLLRRYYADGGVQELARLIAWYLSSGRTLEAEYFLRRWPAPAPGEAPGLREALATELAGAMIDPGAARGRLSERVAVDPLAGALDFESAELVAWQGERAGFRAGPLSPRDGLPGLSGLHGGGALSSREGGERARGALTSPEFRLDGRHLSLLVGGSSRRRQVGVELLVDGVVVASGAGHDSDHLFPLFWDVTPHEGKMARLRVFDQSTRDHVLLDRVLLWR